MNPPSFYSPSTPTLSRHASSSRPMTPMGSSAPPSPGGGFPFPPTPSLPAGPSRAASYGKTRRELSEGGEEAAQGLLSEDLEDGGETEGEDVLGGVGWEGMTPLDETLERIGMGRYQWSLLVLCGFGWMADNMWLQCVAVILPRVQEHYGITDQWIGLLSASIFSGMMVGAAGWGSYSDAKGRTAAFNFTLLITSIFGLLSAFAPSFGWLCLALFGLGTGVGGSMPTDGTLFLENIPKSHHYLLTGLSGFFSLGAVLTSVLGLYIIPRHSCPEFPKHDRPCVVDVENLGWRYMLGSLAAISITMMVCRLVFFRLQESAKFLVTSGRPREAVIALTRISRINGRPKTWVLADVVDQADGSMEDSDSAGRGGYDSMGASPPHSLREGAGGPESLGLERVASRGSTTPPRISRRPSLLRRKSQSPLLASLTPSMARTIDEYLERIEGLFEPRWALTTKLVWTIWTLASAGYTMFNVFLPRFLEQKVGHVKGGRQKSLEDYVLYTMSGIPGSFIGAYLIETSWGRRGTMAASTLVTSLSTLVFIFVSSQTGVVLSSMVVSLAATTCYAVIYGYTPEVFEGRVRGTACGIASALSRAAGIVAPILTGVLLTIDVSLPLYASAACFFVTAACMLSLPYETRGMKKVAPMGH